MGGFTKFLATISLLGVAGLGGNYYLNSDNHPNIETKKEALQHKIVKMQKTSPKDISLIVLADRVSDIDVSYWQPFWELAVKDRKLDSLINIVAKAEEPCKRRECTSRIINIGLANEGQSAKVFKSALEQANKTLFDYGIYAQLSENTEIIMPDEFTSKDLPYAIKYSFDGTHDYYFAWTKKDFKGSVEDYHVRALTKDRVCLIDSDFAKNDLSKLVAQEVLRLLAGKDNTSFGKNRAGYFAPVSRCDVEISKMFSGNLHSILLPTKQNTVK